MENEYNFDETRSKISIGYSKSELIDKVIEDNTSRMLELRAPASARPQFQSMQGFGWPGSGLTNMTNMIHPKTGVSEEYYIVKKSELTLDKILEDNPELKKELSERFKDKFTSIKDKIIKSDKAEEYWRDKFNNNQNET